GASSWAVGTLTPARAGDLSLVLLLRRYAAEHDVAAVVLADKAISLTVLAVFACGSAYALEMPFRGALAVAVVSSFGTAWALVYAVGSGAAAGWIGRAGGLAAGAIGRVGMAGASTR